jgi:TonB family protein
VNSVLQKPFSFYTKRSFAIHVTLIVLVVIVSYFQWSQGEKQRRLNVKLVQSSVRVDVVAMPKKTFQELKALQEMGQTGSVEAEPVKAEPVKKEAAPESGNEFIKEKKKVSFQDMLKQYSNDKVEKSKPSKKAKKGKKGLDKNTLAKLDGLIKRGNKVSQGQALVGSGSAESLTELQGYAAKLPALVKPYWKLPSYLADQNLQCRIRVYINGRGEVLRSNVFEKSSDPEYDERALSAVKAAAPFPPPPASIVSRTLRGDILLGFPL